MGNHVLDEAIEIVIDSSLRGTPLDARVFLLGLLGPLELERYIWKTSALEERV